MSLSGVEMEDSSSNVQAELAKQNFCVKKEPECGDVSVVHFSDSESVLEPIHKVWVTEMPSSESEDEIVETDACGNHSQNTTNLDTDVSAASDDSVSTGWSASAIETLPSSSMATHSSKTVGAIGDVLVDDISVELSEGMEDAATLSSRISNTSGEKSYKCPKCPKVFPTVYRLQVHVKEVHRNGHSKCCEVCMAPFAYSSQLQRHMRTHTGERPFQCDICQVSFKQATSLTRHMRTHTGKFPFQCVECEMPFTRKSHFTTHMRIHAGECPFQCSVCKVFFSRKNNLNVHMRTHTGERPFQCDLCEKSFTQSSKLAKHRRTHTGV